MDNQRAWKQREFLRNFSRGWGERGCSLGWSPERASFHDRVVVPHWQAENGRLPMLRPLREWLSMGWAP